MRRRRGHGRNTTTHDPSGPLGHLPAFARREEYMSATEWCAPSNDFKVETAGVIVDTRRHA
jgi:hypothetical protein